MKLECKVPDGSSGPWTVETFTISKGTGMGLWNLQAELHGDGRTVPEGTFKRLMRGGNCIMSNTPCEIDDLREFSDKVKGDVLINGLGLGIAALMALQKKEVTHLTIVEKSNDVVKLVGPTFMGGQLPVPTCKRRGKVDFEYSYQSPDGRLTIVLADAHTWKPTKGIKYDVVWHDIWDAICSDNLKEMKLLNAKYKPYAKWQGSWGEVECLRALRRGC